MRIDAKAFGLAAGLTAALVSAVCAAFVALAPSTAFFLLGTVTHMDVSALLPQVTWMDFLIGVFFWGLFFGLIFGFAAWLYDRMIGATRRAHTT